MIIKNNKLLMIISVLSCFIFSVIIVLATDDGSKPHATAHELSQKPLIEQKILAPVTTPIPLQKMHYKDQFIGYISNANYIYNRLDRVYADDYQAAFPNSKIDLSDDIYFTTVQSDNRYDNADDAIFAFLEKNELFSIQVNKITFSNGAVIYVKNLEDFNTARKKFLSNYIDEPTYLKLQNNVKIAPLITYGEQITAINVKEKVIFEKGTTTINNIYLDENAILTFLSYGYQPNIETYETVDFDTIEGIASLNGMTALQLITINKETLSDINQILVPGKKLNISTFNSPFTVTVEHERLTSESISAPSTKYINDSSIPKGQQIVDVVERDGAQDSTYLDTYINGSSVSSTLKTSKMILEPVQGVVRVGTYVEPSVGSGIFGRPLNNARVICRVGCYRNHQGTDFATYGSGYGPILAIDRGVVIANRYDPGGWGYFIKIDHQNGYQSLYAHMVSPAYFPVGAVVGKGQNIGYVGMTGRTSTPHVHLEVYRGGGKINPCNVVSC